MTAVAETLQQPSMNGDPEYHFVLCSHTAEHVPQIAAGLEGCDTVFIETVGQTSEIVAENFEFLNALSFGDISEEDADRVVDENLADCDDPDDHFTLLLARELYGSGTLLWPIDAGADHPVYPHIVAADMDMRLFWRRIHKGTYNVNEALDDLEQAFEGEASAYNLREQLVTLQLTEYTVQLPAGRGSRIGVVQGAVHTSTYHDMQRFGLPVSREFVDDTPADPAKKIIFPYAESAVRAKRFYPDKPLPRPLLMDALIDGIVLSNVTLEGSDEEEITNPLTTLRMSFIEGMDRSAKTTFLKNWEKVVSGSAKGRKRRVVALIANSLSNYCDIEV